MKPVIGVIPLWDDEKDSIWMLPGYMDGINEAGGLPIIFPFSADKQEIYQLLDLCDGILLTGGHDVSSELYHEEPLEGLVEYCRKRDVMEEIVLEKALQDDMPVLGICRGVQFINVALGGTLYQDIPLQHPSSVNHHQKAPYDIPAHEVAIVDDSPLHKCLSVKKLAVNSCHHQAIRELAPGLEVMACSPDDLVEAVYMPGKKFLWAVQWHPEFSYKTDDNSRKILRAFVEAANQNGNPKKFNTVITLHYFRLIYRSILFVLLAITYIRHRLFSEATVIESVEKMPAIIYFTWAVFVVEMITRFFPSQYESHGSQKQFARNYMKSGSTDIDISDNNSTMLVALIWIVFNGIFGALHMVGILDDGIMILLCSAYSICDIICILFFCPFQTWFMKNKCCSTCRIYNWDYAMMFTPLFFVRKTYTWSLLALSVALLFRWEITFYLHPERFSEKTNDYLQCRNCSEKLCAHKKQLKSLWKQIEEYSSERIKRLRK